MNWDAIGAIGDFLGAIGVIVSLVYLAIQIRADTRAKRSSAVHAQVEAFRGFLQTLATEGELSSIYFRGINDFSSLKDVERVRFSSALGHLFRVLEEAYFFQEEGNLDPKFWYGFETSIKEILAYRGVQDWWSTRSHWYNEAFRKFVQTIMAERTSPKMYGEKVNA